MNTETPRTDSSTFTACGELCNTEAVTAHFARTLERELAHTQARLDEAKKIALDYSVNAVNRIIGLEAQVHAMREALEQAK